jgi:glycerol-3-phosphate O-acyltransferase
VERKRLALDYYRNNIIQHFVPAAICALALESFSVGAPPADTLRERIRELSRLFKFEFQFRSERHFEDEVRRALDDLKSEGVVREENGFVVKVAEKGEHRSLFCSVLEHFVETYWLTARALRLLQKGPVNEKDYVTRILQMGDRLFVQGDLLLYESLNREVIKNAIKSFADRNVIEITPQEGGRRKNLISLTGEWSSDEKLAELAEELSRFLPGRK